MIGVAADNAERQDLREAAAANLPAELWGKRSANGKRYYRRGVAMQGTPLVPGTYPPLGDVEDTSHLLPTLESEEPGESVAYPSSGGSRARITMPSGGFQRNYDHGGVEPLHPPGLSQAVVIGGTQQPEGLMPMVNFGPAELLQTNFREVADPEACWEKGMSRYDEIKRQEPRSASTKGDCVKDTGGSHETLDFDLSLSMEGLQIGRGSVGSVQKDDSDNTDKGKKRRNANGGHTEVTEETLKGGALDIMKLFLFSMAAVAVEFFYPVMCLLVGARTKWHLDSFFGGCSNAARFATEIVRVAFLILDFRIPFRQCVVKYKDRFFVPMTLGNKDGPVLRVLELLPDGTCDYDESFTREWLYSQDVTIYGYLPYIVLQPCRQPLLKWADGETSFKEKVDTFGYVGIVPDYDKLHPESSLVSEPSESTYVSSLEIIRMAEALPDRPVHMPQEGIEFFDHSDGWIIFRGWQFPHKFQGDPRVRRVNFFSRAMRQVPTGCSIRITKKGRTRKRVVLKKAIGVKPRMLRSAVKPRTPRSAIASAPAVHREMRSRK